MATGKEIAEMLRGLVDRDMTFMHICGTHEAAIARTGLRSILPPQLKIVMGPGCPVCITPQGEIDAALDLVDKDCIIATYGDLLRVPGSKGSLESCGGDVRIVQGVHKAVEIAEKTDKEVCASSRSALKRPLPPLPRPSSPIRQKISRSFPATASSRPR
jgi:Hydrogenase maturation factor